MKTMRERWICPDMDVQVFTPQEFVAACEEESTYYIKTDTYTCGSANMSCTMNGNVLTGHIINGLHFGAKTITLDGSMVQTVQSALENAPDFYIDCGGTVSGPYKVLCAPDMSATHISSGSWGTGHHWHVAQCDMDKGHDIVPGAVAAVSEGWDIVKNHS